MTNKGLLWVSLRLVGDVAAMASAVDLHCTEPPPVGQQTGVILPPTATNARLESLREDGKNPAIVVLCVIRRLALLWVEVLASRASVHASKPPARAAIEFLTNSLRCRTVQLRTSLRPDDLQRSASMKLDLLD